jgi:Na+-translocating ferredoxin:NAD+ oxidoreductase RnfC subunit
MRNLAAGVAEDLAAFTGAFLCSECGLCAVYGCIMNLDPAALNREMKARLSAAGIKRPEPGTRPENVFGRMRAVPSKRLIARLGLAPYDRPAPLARFEQPLQRLSLRLRQHAGAPAVAAVKIGQKLRAFDLVAEIPQGQLGARVHTGLAGTVADITAEAVVIEVE